MTAGFTREPANVRPAAVAGRWYPGTTSALTEAVDRHLTNATQEVDGDLVAIIAPHAGLMYSGAVAAYAYALLRPRAVDVVVIVGPSHFVGFDGVSVYPSGGFATPLGIADIDSDCARALMDTTPVVREHLAPHAREHSLEMQLPFVRRVAPAARIVPLLMGFQTDATARALADALAVVLRGKNAILIASTDLSHYHDAAIASALDRVVIDCVSRFDPDCLQRALDETPEHACGGGPAVAVMRAARLLAASNALVLDYADSGDVSGDKSSVVGYMAAAFGNFGRSRTAS